jgi:hypothetical protein
MPSEGHKRRGVLGFPNGQFVDGLDEAAKGLAAGTISRGKAIKLGGAALLGSMGLLSLFAGKAEAQATVAGLCTNKPAINNTKCPRKASSCGACPTCQCARTVSGKKRCLDFGGVECPATDQCDTNRDCTGNEVCVQVGGCCGHPQRNLCVPPCPTDESMCPPRM